ncbi:ABC transporter permease [Marinobacterium sediminicola]|uniref:NitT/TauT family transport system permease protein n=1 Tax=Marinobacterium sediminicola TaxID=518898 RepID=A0ABY1RXF1_9GAMM|nr:ABC transporter permease [Marinobacterium sediminicola]ULG67747.1 ABC transporter permease [Marinobacterium sediminicola]SMR71607.1 NitT/TauT family transport system permease protein [Marinobacterium sediminicola]
MHKHRSSFWTGHAVGRAVLGFVGVIAFVAIWKLAQSTGWAKAGTIPDPFLLPQTLVEEWRAERLLPAVMSSLVHYVWGLSLGTLLGFLVGAVAASSRWADALHAWLARILRPIPPLAWVVFAIAWFKVSHAGAAFVIAIGVFWVNYFATWSAVRNVDPKYYELARAFGQQGVLNQAVNVTLPASAPGILAGMRTGIGQAWMTLIAAELLGVPGMGQEMNAAAGVGAYEAVVIYMLVISLVYTLSDTLFARFEKRVLQWRPS